MHKKVIRRAKSAKFIFQKYLTIFIGAFIAAIGLEWFLVPNHVIDGGVVGLSIMGEALTELPFELNMIILNLPFVILGYKIMGKRFALATFIAICFLSFWTSILEGKMLLTTDPFLSAIFGGIVDGIGVGLIIRAGGSLDGTEIVAIIADKKTVFSVGEIVMFINLFILSGAGFVFGRDYAMYSLVAYFVIAKMIDVVITGLDSMYAVMIVTNDHKTVTDELNSKLKKGVTLLHGEGGYTGESKEILYSVVTRLEVDKLKEIVLDIDENAFITIYPVNDIIGGRFKKKGH